MLIQMFFYILMLFGIAALAIDMGYVRLTQSLMDNAADTAALEGLRQRDRGEAARRDAAKNMIFRAFDDGGNPADPRYMSAGPNIQMGPAGDELNANQFYDQHTLRTAYNPSVGLQPNNNNCKNGDMVSGNLGTGDPSDPSYHQE